MKKINLFSDKVLVCYSEISDGNMRFFDGDENLVIKNQENLCSEIGISSDDSYRVRVIYNGRENFTEYLDLDSVEAQKFCIKNPEADIPVFDGIVTKTTSGLLLPLADCLGIVVYDEEHKILGLLHAGRHNIEQNGAKKFIDFLVQNYKCEAHNLKIWFSPCAQNYEVYALKQKLPEAATSQLLGAGCLAENIFKSDIDTATSENLPSCSCGDKTSRFAIIVRQKSTR